MSSPANDPASLRVTALDIADPRSDRATGMRAIEPPVDTRQAVRGNLYASVELRRADGRRLQIDEATRVQFGERLLSTLQRVYYSAKGTQSTVLLTAVQQALNIFEQHRASTSQPLAVDIVCAALLGDKLATLATGEGFVLAATPEAVQLFPAQPDLPASPNSPAEDSTEENAENSVPDPSTLVHRLTVGAGDAIFLGGGSWSEHVGVRALAEIIAATDASNREEVVDHLWRTIGQTLDEGAIVPGLLLTIEAGGRPAGGRPTGARPASGTASPAPPTGSSQRDMPRRASIQDASTQNTPTQNSSPQGPSDPPPSIYAPPPARNLSPDSAPPPAFPTQTVYGQSAPNPSPNTGERAAAQVFPSRTVEAASAAPPWTEPIAQQRDSAFVAEPGDAPDAESEWQELTTPAAGVAERVATLTRGGANRVNQLLRSVLPDRSATVMPNPLTPPPLPPTSPEQDAADSAEAGPARTRPTVVFTPPKRASGRRMRLAILVAVLIALLVPMIVLAVTASQGANRSADAAQLKQAAQADYNLAKTALDNGDESGALSALSDARQTLREAEAIVGLRDDEINELKLAIERDSLSVLKVRPLYGLDNPLATFSDADADPHSLLVVDQDVYVLDRGRNLVQRFRLDEQNERVIEDQSEVVLQRGQTVGGAEVGPLVDMTWQPPNPGFEDRANLLVLDRSNNVFRYNGRVEGATLAVFGEQSAWDTPSQLQTYSGNVYLADEGRRQIFRYAPAGAGYDNPPEPWFVSDTFGGEDANEAFIDLGGLREMMIDGDIWLLYADGRLIPYNQGIQRPFELDNSRGLLTQPVDAFIDAQESGSIYIADADEGSVLVYNRQGGYEYQMRAAEEGRLRGLSSIYVDETTGQIYLLTKSALFVHPLVD